MREGYKLVQKRYVEEVGGEVSLIAHTQSGAMILSIANKDVNKVFGVTFKTPAQDDTGITHILEHTVFNGSKKYPIKDPFVELNKGTVASFINAFTYPDRTCYPVASTNEEDFYNLIDVYLDAVFNPLLSKEAFMQEGWHYEVDEEDILKYKGIVFNEMKGVFSNPESLLSRNEQHELFSDTEYAHESGGKPEAIVRLGWEDLKNYHKRYYHPSNALFFFWGDDSLEKRLQALEHYLESFKEKSIPATVKLQPAFEPKRIKVPYSTQDTEANKHWVSISWLLGESANVRERLVFDVLEHVLLGNSSSLLSKRLLASNLGTDLTPCGIETDLRQTSFSVGLKGVSSDNTDSVIELILDSLKGISEKTIDESIITGAINQLEFDLRENNTGSYPQGLSVMLWALQSWLYGEDIFEALGYSKILDEMRRSVNSEFLQSLIKKYLAVNRSYVVVELFPDGKLLERREKAEKEKLVDLTNSLESSDRERILQETKAVLNYQSLTDVELARSVLPHLSVDDLAREISRVPIEELKLGNTTVLKHDLFTNDIAYVDWGFDFSEIDKELLPFVGLWKTAILEMGTERREYGDLLNEIDMYTGGLSTQLLISPRIDGTTCEWVLLSGKSLVHNIDNLVDLSCDVLLNSQFKNQQRLKEIILQKINAIESDLIPRGHSYVNSRLDAQVHPSGVISEITSGIEQLLFLRKLIENFDTEWETIAQKLEMVTKQLAIRNHLVCNVTVDKEKFGNITAQLEKGIDNFPELKHEFASKEFETFEKSQALIAPVDVHYVGKALVIDREIDPKTLGTISTIANWLSREWLWNEIRVKGGAYGGFSLFNPLFKSLSLLSYRDPNISSTLMVYKSLHSFLNSYSLSDWERERMIISTIGDFDRHRLPDQQGLLSLTRYLAGMTDEYRQEIRNGVFAVDNKSLSKLSELLQGAKEKFALLSNDKGVRGFESEIKREVEKVVVG